MHGDPTALGYDTTMILREIDGERHYDIIVRLEDGEEQTYRTLDILADDGGRRLFGSGTRVWKAIRILDGQPTGEPVAIKDSWVYRNREREGTVWSKIMNSASNEDETKGLKAALLTLLAHGDVFNSASPDCTWLLEDGLESVTSDVESGSPKDTSSEQEGQGMDGSDPEVPYSAIRPATSKVKQFVHYRTVYQEICQPLSNVTSLSTFFGAMSQAVDGMHLSLILHDLCTHNVSRTSGTS